MCKEGRCPGCLAASRAWADNFWLNPNNNPNQSSRNFEASVPTARLVKIMKKPVFTLNMLRELVDSGKLEGGD